MQGCIAMWAVNWLLSPAVLQVLPLLLWATLGAIVSTQDLLCNMLITFLDRFLQLSPAFTCHIEHQCSKFFLNSFFCMSCFWQLSIKGIYVDHLYWHYSSASVSCPMMDCCRVDDMSPLPVVTGLSPGWVNPSSQYWLTVHQHQSPSAKWYVGVHKVSSNEWALGSCSNAPMTRRWFCLRSLFMVRACHMPDEAELSFLNNVGKLIVSMAAV